jgi:UPF0755 protein
MRKRLPALLAGLAMIVAITTSGGYLWLQRYLDTPLPITTAVAVEIRQGSAMTQVATQLEELTGLRHPKIFTLWTRYSGKDTAIRAGEFELQPGTTPRTALAWLLEGTFVQYPVVFIEGSTVHEALAALWNSPKLLPTLQGSSDAQILAALNSSRVSLEGLLFPDTYFYTAGTTDLSIMQRAARRLDEVLAQEWELRAENLPYVSPYDALTMASIIEKESGSYSEREEIAGVFVRRLQSGMRLQSDPTVIYGLGVTYDGNIRRIDLETTTPYNTYRIDGLPPSPIALSGRDAIHASLHPKEGSFLYFVARGDGGHVFSTTLDEHNAAVRRYQLEQQLQ